MFAIMCLEKKNYPVQTCTAFIITSCFQTSFQLEEPEEPKVLTPEEQLADKLRLKKLQEESDLELAKETFGKWGCGNSVALELE